MDGLLSDETAVLGSTFIMCEDEPFSYVPVLPRIPFAKSSNVASSSSPHRMMQSIFARNESYSWELRSSLSSDL